MKNLIIVALEKNVEKLRKDIEEGFLTVYPSNVNDRIQEISVSASEEASALERWVTSCFTSHIQQNSKRSRIEKRWDLLVQRADVEKSFELTERYKETKRLIQETEQEYEKCNGEANEVKPYIANLENEDDYPALLAKVEKKFHSLMKYLSDNFVPPQESMPFYREGYCLSIDEASYLWFCPYYFLLINKQKNKLSVRALYYGELLLAMDTQTVSLDYGEKVPNGFEIMGHHWEYERADGQRNMRYKDNRLRYGVKIYELFISAQDVTKKITFASAADAERLIKCFQEYRNLLFDEKVDRIINRIFQCESTPDIIHIHDDVMKIMKAEADVKKQAEKEAKAAQLLAQKKEEEAKEAALRKAAEERRIREEKEKELEERWLRLQHQMASEEQLIQEKEDVLRTAERLLENDCDQIPEKYAAKESPLDVDAKHRTITNSMTKISLVQGNTIDCPKYALWFVDAKGQRISNVRLLEQKGVGETSLIQFELKSQSGFSSSKDSLLVFDGKGKLMGCSLYEKGDHHERPKKGTVDLVIPPGVTALGSRIFSDWTSLRSVYIPDTVTKIGSGCFYGCTALRSVRLPKNLQELPSRIFAYTKSLKQIELPVALTEIKNLAFDSSGLTAISIPENVVGIFGDAFIECNKLLDITITGKLTTAMTTGDIEHIFDIEYKKEKYKKFKFTVELEQNPEKWAVGFADHGFSAKASKKKRAKYGCVNLYEWFRVAGLLNKQNQMMGDSDFNQFVTSMKGSIQDTGYNLGEEHFTGWLNDMTDMGYDFTYQNAFFKVSLKNATFAAVQAFSLLKQKGAFVDGSYAECPEFKIKLEDIMEFVCCLRSVDKSTEIQVNCYIGGWSSSFAGYSFTLNEGQYFPSYIYLNEFLRM